MGGPFHHSGGGGGAGGNITECGSGHTAASMARKGGGAVTGRPEHLKARVKGLGLGHPGSGLGGKGSEASTTNPAPHGLHVLHSTMSSSTTSLSPPRPQPPPPLGLSSVLGTPSFVGSSPTSLFHPAVAMVVEQLKQQARLRERDKVGDDDDVAGKNGREKGHNKDNDKRNVIDHQDYETSSNMQALAMRMKSSGKKQMKEKSL